VSNLFRNRCVTPMCLYLCPGSSLGEAGTWNNDSCKALTLHAVLQVLGLALLHDNYWTTPPDSWIYLRRTWRMHE